MQYSLHRDAWNCESSHRCAFSVNPNSTKKLEIIDLTGTDSEDTEEQQRKREQGESLKHTPSGPKCCYIVFCDSILVTYVET